MDYKNNTIQQMCIFHVLHTEHTSCLGDYPMTIISHCRAITR